MIIRVGVRSSVPSPPSCSSLVDIDAAMAAMLCQGKHSPKVPASTVTTSQLLLMITKTRVPCRGAAAAAMQLHPSRPELSPAWNLQRSVRAPTSAPLQLTRPRCCPAALLRLRSYSPSCTVCPGPSALTLAALVQMPLAAGRLVSLVLPTFRGKVCPVDQCHWHMVLVFRVMLRAEWPQQWRPGPCVWC
jgi:hypothetical protein